MILEAMKKGWVESISKQTLKMKNKWKTGLSAIGLLIVLIQSLLSLNNAIPAGEVVIYGLVLTSAIITVGIAHPTRELRITWWKYVFFVGWAVPTFAQ